MSRVAATLRFARTIHAVSLASMLLYVVVGEQVGPKNPRELGILLPGLAVVSLTVLGVAVALRSRMLGRPRRRCDSAPTTPGRCNSGAQQTLCLLSSASPLRFLDSRCVFWAARCGRRHLVYATGILLMVLWTPRLEFPQQG